MRVVVGLLVTAGLWVGARAAQQPEVFRSRTVVTELEVDVRGPDGVPVDGLAAADFEVVEDGELQAVLSVDPLPRASSPTPADTDARTTVVSTAAGARTTNQQRRGTRAWAIVVDDLRVAGFLRDRIRACLDSLVATLPAGDLIALVPTSGRREAGREFTRDRATIQAGVAAMRFPRAFDGVQGVASTDTLAAPAGQVGERVWAPDRLDLVSADNLLVSTLGNVASMLGRSNAPRPTMVVIGHGIRVALSDDYRRSLEATGANPSALRRYDEMRDVLRRVQRSGVTMHVIDPAAFDQSLLDRLERGERLAGPRAWLLVRRDDPSAAFRVVAAQSGGQYVADAVDPEAAVRQVLDAASAGYVLRYAPSRDTLDDRLRRVEVRVRRAGATVRSRSAYARVPDPEFEALRRGKPLGVAVAGVVPSPALGLEVVPSQTPSGAKATAAHLALRVTGTDTGVALPATDTLEVLGIAVDDRGRERAKAGGRFPAVIADGVLAPPPLVLAPLAAGRHHVRIAVRSVALDRTGSVFLDIDVPRR